MRRVVERNVAILLLGMIVLDVVLLVRVSAANRRVQSIDTVLRSAAKNEVIPKPEGFARDGTRLNISDSGKGWAIRYAEVGCKYCASDAQWKLLASKLQEAGFEIIVLLPSPKGEYPQDGLVPKGIQQAAFMNVEWIKHFRLSVTPTILLFDNRQRLLWQRQGVLDSQDVASAVRVINGSS